MIGSVSEGVAALATTARLLVATDFDGTISELVAHPDLAEPVQGALDALAALADLADTTVAVVSGRSLDTLRRRAVWPERVQLIGSHGSEFETVDFHLDAVASQRRRRVIELVERLSSRVTGSETERKPYGIAFHYRHVGGNDATEALADIQRVASDVGDIHLMHGKFVVELAVVSVSKAWAMETLRASFEPTRVVYFGDDVTDEAAFAVLGVDDVTCKVGSGSTAARLRVATPTDAVDFLRALAAARTRWLGVSL